MYFLLKIILELCIQYIIIGDCIMDGYQTFHIKDIDKV